MITCSINIYSSCPAKSLQISLEIIVDKYIDKKYTLSLDQVEARQRMKALLQPEYMGLFLQGEISGAEAYIIMISLASACGAVFESFVYRTCIKLLMQSLVEAEVSNIWTEIQTTSLYKISSCFLPILTDKVLFEETLELFFSNISVNNSYDAATICYDHLSNFIGE